MFRIAVRDEKAWFTFGDPFDGMDEARAVLAASELEGARVEEFTGKGWAPVDVPVKRKGRWPFRKR